MLVFGCPWLPVIFSVLHFTFCFSSLALAKGLASHSPLFSCFSPAATLSLV